ncbi:hypothetical protein JCM19237_4329 [Photobacterium aphoticum]|uniref:Uncharacterized protein n=1 Tax=Photobacterium aphoticum TaxID=754436 RepID=A0A090QRU1_9GAMM|nr:hypothetical protein JCM19237_4329 [Photobacterium aphoticum]
MTQALLSFKPSNSLKTNHLHSLLLLFQPIIVIWAKKIELNHSLGYSLIYGEFCQGRFFR